jgi:hypothetical protein
MSKEDDYRRNAAESVELAHRASTTRDKSRLLGLAEKWLDLADRAQRLARYARGIREHPLVQDRFGGDQPKAE